MPTPSTIGVPSDEMLPVLVWIHGGSQTVTFGSSASGLCDPTNLVRKSIEMESPIIVVTLNYRLNLFAFGDCNGEKNLALSDQRAALKFVRQHIIGFGGDPENITLAGESAGAVYVHAHMVMGVPMRQAILQSGSLVEEHLSLKNCPSASLRNASVPGILKAQADLGIVSLFLQMEPGLENWRDKLGYAERLLIGDCEVSAMMSQKWIEFIAGKNPWGASDYFALGPLGKSMVIDEDEYASRRRKRHCDAIKRIGADRVDEVWKALAIGNMSFNN
ncbi:hypothetical protein E8E11_005512 [Didymella keratinophila]|nr:hypothetical protein E8E11_005512 [Didymella keratinophila]